MSSNYKCIQNGNGTDLTIGEGKYISIGKNGTDITIRGNGKVIAFDSWKQFIDSINPKQASYYNEDDKSEDEEREEGFISEGFTLRTYKKEMLVPIVSINDIEFEVNKLMETLNDLRDYTMSWDMIGDYAIKEKDVKDDETMNALVELGIAVKFKVTKGIYDKIFYKKMATQKFDRLYAEICNKIIKEGEQ